MLPPAVMWIDPGGMTGIACYYRNEHRLEVGEYPFQRAGEIMWQRMQQYNHAMAVGWERFTIFPDTHKLTPQAEPVEVIGLARWISTVWQCRQLTPAQQHTPDATDAARLKKLDWWLPGKNDAQSAAAHLLNWMLRAGELPPKERALIADVKV